jgi:molybdenum cofactor guanylyltransferase
LASAIILAGGRSRRMGQPKAILKFGTSTILQRILDELQNGFDDIAVIAAPAASESFPIERLLRPTSGFRLLRDEAPFQGAANALVLGLNSARHETIFATSCDLPLLSIEVARALCRMLRDHDAVIPIIAGDPQPICAVYRRGIAAFFADQLAAGERRLTSIVAGLKAYRPEEVEMRRIDPDLKSFLNVNTPADYARALALLPSE